MGDATTEQHDREWAWMHARLFADRRKLLRFPDLRARALLTVGADRIAEALTPRLVRRRLRQPHSKERMMQRLGRRRHPNYPSRHPIRRPSQP